MSDEEIRSHFAEVRARMIEAHTGQRPDADLKADAGKAPIHRGVLAYFPNAIEAVAQISAFGAKKYDWSLSWQRSPSDRYADALVRHLVQDVPAGRFDEESGLLHAAHAAWNALARLELILMERP